MTWKSLGAIVASIVIAVLIGLAIRGVRTPAAVVTTPPPVVTTAESEAAKAELSKNIGSGVVTGLKPVLLDYGKRIGGLEDRTEVLETKPPAVSVDKSTIVETVLQVLKDEGIFPQPKRDKISEGLKRNEREEIVIPRKVPTETVKPISRGEEVEESKTAKFDPRCDARCQAARVIEECGPESQLFYTPARWPVVYVEFEAFLKRECPPRRKPPVVRTAHVTGGIVDGGDAVAEKVTYRPCQSPDLNEVRKCLQSYDGPVWNAHGQVHRKYMNRQVPPGSVPCKPPGYDHVVFCKPRGR